MRLSGLAAAAVTIAALAAPAAVAGETPKALLHGNYCGPGNNAPLAPIDALDAACARHDECTPDGGLASKACNLRLQSEAEGVAQDPSQPADLRALAGVVASGAAMMPSRPGSRAIAPAGIRRVDEAPALARPDGDAAPTEDTDDADPE
ncbi:hypothetical protein [Methylobacterium sp.]|jgi:tRNA(fMet)-specific endonuclease VapC|uniref:hypothetical protein n=1 Tax=Methylobacterium sp. TaxID=409 RepID=UPI0025F4270B|nr:hypothetical protein [Methylobacterium sp.]MBY0257006.1 hypothetical protein [Methylobacterium sp.]